VAATDLQFDQVGYKWIMVHCGLSGKYRYIHTHTCSQAHVNLSNGALFSCLHGLIWTLGWLRDFETVMQTRDVVGDLHDFREFSQPRVFCSRYVNTEKVFYCFYKIILTNMRESNASQPCFITVI